MCPLPLKGGVYHRPAVPFPRKGPVKKISLSRLEGLTDIVLIKKCNRRLAGTIHDPSLGQLHPLADIAGAKGFRHYGGKADRRVRRKPGNAFPHRAVLILPGKIAELVQATYTAEQIAARRSNVTITVDEGSAATAEDIFTAMLAADQFHTFAEWKRMGYSVKKGAKSAITCQLWKYTDKPGKAVREAAEAAGKDAPETDPHFYMAKAHLFHALQVEKSKR